MSRPPVGFVNLATARDCPKGTLVSVVGVVVDVTTPLVSAKGDRTLTIRLLDMTNHDATNTEGLRIRFFGDVNALPLIKTIGDVVLLRRVKRWEYQGPMLISNFSTQVVVFPKGSISQSGSSTVRPGATSGVRTVGNSGAEESLTPEEHAYVVGLHHALASHMESLTVPNTSEGSSLKRTATIPVDNQAAKRQKMGSALVSTFGAKYRPVAGLRHMEYADIVVEVVKKWNADQKVELYVTDYTENKDLWLYDPPEAEPEYAHGYEGDPYQYQSLSKKNWQGPWGQRVLKVNVMEPHAATARTVVKEGSIVWLHNLKAKANLEGKLEGDMWPDHTRPSQDNVRLLKSRDLPEIVKLMRRKTDYLAARDKQQRRIEAANRAQDIQPAAQGGKAGKKRKKTKAAQVTKDGQHDESAQKKSPKKAGNDKNQYIRCAHPDAQAVNLREVMDHNNNRHKARDKRTDDFVIPFINAKYRTKVRVVDFQPKSIADFAFPSLANTQTDSMYDDAIERDTGYEWFFSLLLEDASAAAAIKTAREQTWVHVQHTDAQYLLGNDMGDPADLHQSPKLLAQLKEKLCILWGNLEEKGRDEPLKNMPFECCISEYGVKVPDDHAEAGDAILGWKKMFALFGTTIL